MELQTFVETLPSQIKIGYTNTVTTLGSCFAQEIAARLLRHRFRVAPDAFGALFNPASIAHSIKRLQECNLFTQEDLIEVGGCGSGIWCTFSHHSSFASDKKELALEKMNDALLQAASKWSQSSAVIVTLGSAITYKNISYGNENCRGVVSNCHKLPQKGFAKETMSVASVVETLSPLIEANGNKLWIFTVSPVRHIREGAHLNQLSKATLLLAIDEICSHNSNCVYFPAYEIFIDQLRDYRFCSGDLCHPSKEAADYIYSRFCEDFLNQRAKEILPQVESIVCQREHRPMFPQSESYGRFKENLDKKIERLKKDYPEVTI